MRLWHQALLPHLPRQQLLGQHRECCALRGKGWGRPHATVNYVFKHKYEYLVAYHHAVMGEMMMRGYNVYGPWWAVGYRGKNAAELSPDEYDDNLYTTLVWRGKPVYREHGKAYLKECLDNLREKGINIQLEEGLV